VLAVGTLAVELGAPCALLGGRLARLWALVAWSFHVGVVLAMNVWFPYPLLGLAFLPMVDAERPLGWLAFRLQRPIARLGRKRPRSAE
jgi:hypothetical protein